MCCSDKGKSRVSPGNQVRQYVRVNGLSKPFHYLQVIAWIVLCFFGLVYFGVAAPAVSGAWKIAAFLSVGLLYIIHIATHIVATIVNPADENAKSQIKNNHEVPTFDRSKHRHVIENEFCNLCETYVKTTSKHCRACNKCVRDFDHHCLWLNNCVGGINYRYFFATITSAFLGTMTIAAVALFVFINSFVEFNALDGGVWWRSASLETFQAILAIAIVLCVLASGLLGQLVFFHIFLFRRKMTTYDYIQYKRAKESTISGPPVGKNDTNALEDDTANCAAPAVVVEVPIVERAETPINSNGVIKQQDRYSNAATVAASSEIHQNSKSVTLQSEDEIRSQFTNAAFSPDEQKNTNNSSNVLLHVATGEDTGSIASSLGEMTNWNTEIGKKQNASPNGSISSEYLRRKLTDDMRKSSPVTRGKNMPRRKRTRSLKKLVMSDDGMPRPLPVLPENSNPSISNGSLRKKTVLPPLRSSADWTSSMEDLYSNVSQQKLPSITPSSSINSFTSYASGSVRSSRPSEFHVTQ